MRVLESYLQAADANREAVALLGSLTDAQDQLLISPFLSISPISKHWAPFSNLIVQEQVKDVFFQWKLSRQDDTNCVKWCDKNLTLASDNKKIMVLHQVLATLSTRSLVTATLFQFRSFLEFPIILVCTTLGLPLPEDWFSVNPSATAEPTHYWNVLQLFCTLGWWGSHSKPQKWLGTERRDLWGHITWPLEGQGISSLVCCFLLWGLSKACDYMQNPPIQLC